MNEKFTNKVENHEKKSNSERIKYIAIAKTIFTVCLFILTFLDNTGCDCFMGGFCGGCLTINYMFGGFISIPSAVLSFGSSDDNIIPSIIGSIIFIGINVLFLINTTNYRVKIFEIICIIFAGIILLIELCILLIKLYYTLKKKKN